MRAWLRLVGVIGMSALVMNLTACSEDVTSCTSIDRLPYSITTPGTYCVVDDLSAKGTGIEISASDVSIDLGGHLLSGPKAADVKTSGIVSSDKTGIRIRNGRISGWLYGIYLSDLVDKRRRSKDPFEGGHHLITGVSIDSAKFRGIRVEGRQNVVRENVVRWIGGSNRESDAYAIGIESFGPSAVIADNQVLEVRGRGRADRGEGVGISISDRGSGSILRNNLISNSTVEPDRVYSWPAESRSSYGIWIGGSSAVLIEGNAITNFVYGITYKRSADGVLVDNTVMGGYVAFYLPALEGESPGAVDGEGNRCDLDECWHTVERDYLPKRALD